MRRALMVIFLQVGSGAVDEGSAIARIALDRIIKGFDREFLFAFPQVSHAAVVEGLCVCRIERD